VAELLPVEEAQNQILSEFSPLPTEQVPVERSLDHVLAVDIVAPFDLPAYPFPAWMALPSKPVKQALPAAVNRLN